MNSLTLDKWIDLYVISTEVAAFGLLFAASALAGAVILRMRRRAGP